MRLVESYGEVYRMSRRSYRKMLRAIANGTALTWAELGAKRIGRVDANTTDMSKREAAYYLKEDAEFGLPR